MRTTRQWLGSLALAALALQGMGCELIYVAIAAASSDPDIPIDQEPSPLCATVMNGQLNPIIGEPDFGRLPEEGAQIRVAGRLSGQGLATADSVAFFFTIASDPDDYQPIDDLDVAFEGSGKLETLEWETCPTLFDQAVVIAHPRTAGSGKIKVTADGDELKTFSFDIAEATSMAIAVDAGGTQLEAQLFDDAGNVLYANDILWQIAPFAGGPPTTYGNLAMLPDPFSGATIQEAQELIVTASRGSLTTSLTFKRVAGSWQVVPDV